MRKIMRKLLSLAFLVSCGLGQGTVKNKVDQNSAYRSDTNASGELQADSQDTTKPAIADPNNIDLKGLLSSPENIALAKSVFKSFEAQIINFAKNDIPAIDQVDFDRLFDEVVEAAKTVNARELNAIIDELDPIVMSIIEKDPILGTAESLKVINEKKPLFIALARAMGPNILQNGLGSLNMGELVPRLLSP